MGRLNGIIDLTTSDFLRGEEKSYVQKNALSRWINNLFSDELSSRSISLSPPTPDAFFLRCGMKKPESRYKIYGDEAKGRDIFEAVLGSYYRPVSFSHHRRHLKMILK